MGHTDPSKRTQVEQIYDHIRARGSITAIEAAQVYGCLACHSRIADIRKLLGPDEAVDVEHMSGNGKRYAIYRIVRRVEQMDMFGAGVAV